MNMLLKCVVSGFINETRIDTSDNITKWLAALKKLQEASIGPDEVIKKYKRMARYARPGEGTEISKSQYEFPLSITITHVEEEIDNKYF